MPSLACVVRVGSTAKESAAATRPTGNWTSTVANFIAEKFASPQSFAPCIKAAQGVLVARVWSRKTKNMLTRKLKATGA